MQNLIQFLLSDPRVNLISLILTGFSIVLAVVLYVRSVTVKVPRFSIRTRIIIAPELAKDNPIRITFLDNPIENLSLTHIAFWNSGRATISHSDIAESDPLRIVVNDARILSAEITIMNRPANSFKATLDPEDGALYIYFDFVDHMDGAILQIYHTADSPESLKIMGTIKGAKQLQNQDKVMDIFLNIMEKHQELFLGFLDRITPKWLRNLLREVESQQNFVGLFLLHLILYVVWGPFIISYMISGVLIVFIGMIYTFSALFLNSQRMPKELYRVMNSP